MARNLKSAIEEIEKEEETSVTDTPPAQPQETPADTPAPEDSAPATEDSTDDTPPAQPQETPAQPQESPAHHAFRRQLEKQEARHKDEIDALNKSWEAKFDELKGSIPKKEPEIKTREDFPDDDSYIAYLAEQRVNAIMSERDKQAAEAKAKADEAAKAQQAADAELEERRTAWQNTVNSAFGQDVARRDAFLKRVEYCNQRGLGTVLDESPVASNYLLGSTTGVKVLEKLLSDVQVMRRVFNDNTAQNPLEMYWQLKQVETEVLTAEKAAQQPTPTPAAPAPAAPAPTLPHGKPGKQAAGNNAPDIWNDDKAMLAFLRSR